MADHSKSVYQQIHKIVQYLYAIHTCESGLNIATKNVLHVYVTKTMSLYVISLRKLITPHTLTCA